MDIIGWMRNPVAGNTVNPAVFESDKLLYMTNISYSIKNIMLS